MEIEFPNGHKNSWCLPILPRSCSGIVLASVVFAAGCDICASNPSPVIWEQTFGGADTFAVGDLEALPDGGFTILASVGTPSTYFENSDESDFYLLRTNAAGAEDWSARYGSFDYEYARELLVASDGGYFLAGTSIPRGQYFSPNYTRSIAVVRTDPEGTQQWFKTYGDSGTKAVHSSMESSEGSLFVAGSAVPARGSDGDFYLLRIDAAGNEIWSRAFGAGGENVILALRPAEEGGIIAFGYSSNKGYPIPEYYFHKYHLDRMGQELDRVEGTEPVSFIVQAAVPLDDGDYIVAGSKEPQVGIARVSGDSRVLWENAFQVDFGAGAPENTDYVIAIVSRIVATEDGGFILSGFVGACCPPACLDGFVIKTDSEGNPSFMRQYGHTGSDYVDGLAILPDGTYVGAASSASADLYRDVVYLFKAGP